MTSSYTCVNVGKRVYIVAPTLSVEKYTTYDHNQYKYVSK